MPIESAEILEQQIQHLLVAVEHELRSLPDGIDELTLIRKLQSPPWQLIGDLEFHDPGKLYPVHFLLFHTLYRLRDSLAEAGENLIISPLRIHIENQNTVGGNGMPGTLDNLRNFYLDLSQYELPEDAIEQMMERFWAGHQGAGPTAPETLAAANILGFEEVPYSFSKAKQAFRRAVMQAHPDRGGDKETIQSLNEAFAVLKAHFNCLPEQT
ncbi:molecular chaperone DnaJ [Marinobacter sp. F3R11]|nr:molecular chaperone DnaJ [Marinobacter sp. F3R11]